MLELDDTEELELTELDEETELLDTEELELTLLELLEEIELLLDMEEELIDDVELLLDGVPGSFPYSLTAPS